MKRLASQIVAGVCLLAAALSLCAAEPVKIGVLAFRAKAQSQAQWQPLAAVLKRAIPQRDFVIEALTFNELEAAVASRQLDFVLTNPGNYLLMAHRSGLSAPLATLINAEYGQPLSAFGGVIFSQSKRKDINTLVDLQGKTIASTGIESLGGYQMQVYELAQKGIRIPRDAKLLTVGMPHDNVVNAVLEGRADAGFVRTGVLEAMAQEGRLDIDRLKVLNRQDLPGFPAQVSTRLFPEWPFAALPHTDEDLARRVAATLFTMEEDSAATQAMKIHGFTVPADYTPVADLLRELRLPPFEAAPEFTPQDVWARYPWPIRTTLIAGGLVLLLIMRMLISNRRLFAQQRILEQQTRLLRESEERWRFALEGSGDGVWDWDVQEDQVVFSKRYKEMYGFSDQDIAANEEAWAQRIHPDDKARVEADIHAYLDGRTASYVNEHRVRCKDGSIKWVLARGMIVSRDSTGKPLRMIGTHADITERKTAEEHVRRMAHYDALTDLPNRSLFNDRLQQAVTKARRDKAHMAVMFLDLDKFKPVNDTLGHEIGDLLLKQVARRLLDSVRASDTVARIGGDEFVVLLPTIEQEQDAKIVAEKILYALRQPFEVSGHTLHISLSIGVAVYPEHGEDEKLLLINADIAMYHAKKSGRDNFQFYSKGMQGIMQ